MPSQEAPCEYTTEEVELQMAMELLKMHEHDLTGQAITRRLYACCTTELATSLSRWRTLSRPWRARKVAWLPSWKLACRMVKCRWSGQRTHPTDRNVAQIVTELAITHTQLKGRNLAQPVVRNVILVERMVISWLLARLDSVFSKPRWNLCLPKKISTTTTCRLPGILIHQPAQEPDHAALCNLSIWQMYKADPAYDEGGANANHCQGWQQALRCPHPHRGPDQLGRTGEGRPGPWYCSFFGGGWGGGGPLTNFCFVQIF